MTPRFEPPSPDRLRARQQAAASALDAGVLILPGAPVLHRSRDTEYPYRPDSELFWLTGLALPGTLAVLRRDDDEPHLTLFIPPRDPEAELWSGPRLDPDEARERTGAREVHSRADLDRHLPGLLDGHRTLLFRMGAGGAVERHVVEALQRARRRGQRTGSGPRGVRDPGEILDELRLRKDDEEIARMRAAAALTVDAFRQARDALVPGVSERYIQSVLEAAFLGGGGDGAAFPIIVGSGPNACVLHYDANARTVQAGELVLVDAGAAVDLYAADVSRTWPVGPEVSSAQADVHRVVDEARAAAIETVRPGARLEEVHDAAVARVVLGLVELGVLDGDVDALLEAEAWKPFFPHQTSHWLGLDVHDVGDYARDGVSRVLEPGMVLTVEPGLYFGPGALEAAPEGAGPFEGIGVRIEDDVLVTADGRTNLTADLPTGLDGR